MQCETLASEIGVHTFYLLNRDLEHGYYFLLGSVLNPH